MKACVLYERDCIDCSECERCDRDPDKICDNCCLCIASEDYNGVIIDEMLMDDELEEELDTLGEEGLEALKLFVKENFYE